MKVGIVTHHWPYNFGANLQVFSTSESLRKLGHEPFVLDYRPPEMVARYEKLVSHDQKKVHQDYCERFLTQSQLCHTTEEVSDEAKRLGIEVVISGSDAVLRLDPRSSREDLNFPNPFWLDWAKNAGIQRTGFLAASSMGSNYLSLSRKKRKQIGATLKGLNFIGLRDRWTIKMLGLCDRNLALEFCPDPVSVFNESCPAVPAPEFDADYIAMSLYPSTVDPLWIEEFTQAAHQNGLKVVSLPHPESLVKGPFDHQVSLPLSPQEWYAWIQHSVGYVGVRFHPIMIALTNGLPFVALDHYESGLRFSSRALTFAARPLKPWLRFLSKTYDLATRADREEYCLNPRQFGKLSGSEVFELFNRSRRQGPASEFRERSSEQFWKALETICQGSQSLSD